MTRTTESEQEEWLNLETIFVGRTIHIHSLSPLHVLAPFQTISISCLKSLAEKLHDHLSTRFNDTLSFSLGGTTSSSKQSDVIHKVQSSFITEPQICSKGVPRPFAIEIQINQPYPTINDPNGKRLEYAHLVFFSTSSRQTDTHYPLLLWKPSLAGRAAPLESQSGDGTGDGTGDAGQAALTAKLLTTHTLSFIAAFFDCRLSFLPPLHCIRGKNLEEIAQKILMAKGDDTSHEAMELTFALPAQVRSFDDDDDNDEIMSGPAPQLNTISLSVPAAILDLLRGDRLHQNQLFSTLRQYMSEHTSIQLSKLTLTRVGVGPVYLGSPTSIVTQAGKANNGEVRLKVQKDKGGQSQYALIVLISDQLIRIADQEGW